MQSNINTVLEDFDKFVSKNYKKKFGLSSSNRLNWGCEECGGQDAEEDIKEFISTSIQQLLAQRDEEIIKIIENMGRLGLNQREKDWNAMLGWVVAELEDKLQKKSSN